MALQIKGGGDPIWREGDKVESVPKKPVVRQVPPSAGLAPAFRPTGEASGSPEAEVGDTVPTAGMKDILLESVPVRMLVRLEQERKRRGFRSRAETIRVLLKEALDG